MNSSWHNYSSHNAGQFFDEMITDAGAPRLAPEQGGQPDLSEPE